MNFKVAKDAQGNVTACGPNDENFDPAIPPGGTLEISGTFQAVVPSEASVIAQKKSAALKALAEYQLEAALNDPNAPQAVKDYKAVKK